MTDNDLIRFGFSKKSDDLIHQLLEPPKKERPKNRPHVDKSVEKGFTHQADLLFLPNDNGFKYALVVIDIGSRLCDAEPLTKKDGDSVQKAFQTIYRRHPLDIPHLLQSDSGTEFKNREFIQYFRDQGVHIRFGLVNRHRQQSVVERLNGIIARAIFHNLHRQELETGQTQSAWKDDLKTIIKIINMKVKARKDYLKKPENIPPLRCEGNSCNVLEIGTKVRVISDQPTELTGIKLKGKHRITDIRWDPKEREIIALSLRPDQPPMYRVSGKDVKDVSYTKEQLQVVNPNAK